MLGVDSRFAHSACGFLVVLEDYGWIVVNSCLSPDKRPEDNVVCGGSTARRGLATRLSSCRVRVYKIPGWRLYHKDCSTGSDLIEEQAGEGTVDRLAKSIKSWLRQREALVKGKMWSYELQFTKWK